MPEYKWIEVLSSRRLLALILMGSLLLLSFSGLAQASTPAINKAVGQVQALKDLLAQLDEQMSAAAEAYDYANQQLADTQAAVEKTSKELTQGESDLAVAQAQFNQRVVEIYESGNVTLIAVLMDASSFSDLVTRLEQLSRISEQDAKLVKQVQTYTTQVADNKAKLESELKQQTTYVAQTAAAKQKVLDQLAKQNAALKGKEAQVAQLRKEEAARQAALVAAAQRAAAEAAHQAQLAAAAQAAADAAAAAKAKTTTTSTTSGARTTTSTTAGTRRTTTTVRGGKSTTTTSGGGGSTPPTTSAPRTTTTTAGGGGGTGSGGVSGAAIVSYALKFVGVPYVWGGSTPGGFDCSGFSSYVYGHFGIYLPHSSSMQYGYGTAVAQSQLQPGDLLFFYSPIHHVGIAIGNGQMIDCRTGGVQIESLYWSSYTGARRILH